MTNTSKPKSRLFYIDNLRIFLIALVVLHHLAITYGAPGDWYYNEGEGGLVESMLLAMFVASNQSFFMGFFFMIAAYFIPGSLDRKGTWTFLKDRLLRLGLPLLFFFFIISPLVIFFIIHTFRDEGVTFSEYYLSGNGFGFGPLWFVEALLLFTLIFLLFRGKPGKKKVATMPLPGNLQIFLFAILLGLCTFVVRIWLPVGWSLDPFGFQFPHFLQYIAMFIIGLFAYRNQWFQAIDYKRAFRWFIGAQILIWIFFPLIFLTGGAASGEIEVFTGGIHWQSLAYSIWEQLTGFSLVIGLAGIFKEKFNHQGKLAKKLSAGAYTVFIIHTPVLVIATILLRSWSFPLMAKFLLLAPILVALCFLLAEPIRKLPGARRVL